MTPLDADRIWDFLSGTAKNTTTRLEVFAQIDSTNSYLMQQSAPAVGTLAVAVTGNQTAGRGRHGKRWESPPDSGLALSAAFTFATQPDNLPAMTLIVGLTVVKALAELGIEGVMLKWPNDLVAGEGKLGGILTEVQQNCGPSVTVVTGIGINLDVPDSMTNSVATEWSASIVDAKSLCTALPAREALIGELVSGLHKSFSEFEADGFAPFAKKWPRHDWLLHREITLDVAGEKVSGVAAGIGDDGALLVRNADDELRHITSGSVIAIGSRASAA